MMKKATAFENFQIQHLKLLFRSPFFPNPLIMMLPATFNTKTKNRRRFYQVLNQKGFEIFLVKNSKKEQS
jgi:hypothetical protein